jgi:hypothetical protein
VARVAAYLHSSTEEKLLKDIEEQLLANHQMALLDKEETGENADDLHAWYLLMLIYHLLCRLPCTSSRRKN